MEGGRGRERKGHIVVGIVFKCACERESKRQGGMVDGGCVCLRDKERVGGRVMDEANRDVAEKERGRGGDRG